MPTTERFFSTDDPSANGHFPGNPIIPGAVLLHDVWQAIAQATDAPAAAGYVRAVKFLAPVRPGTRVAIEYSTSESGEVTFRCEVAGTPVMTGTVACA